MKTIDPPERTAPLQIENGSSKPFREDPSVCDQQLVVYEGNRCGDFDERPTSCRDLVAKSEDKDASVDTEEETEESSDEEYDGGELVEADLANRQNVPYDEEYESFEHSFISVPGDKRFLLLYTFLRQNEDKKIMVFFSTTKSARYHRKILERFKVSVLSVHMQQKRELFIDTFLQFSEQETGVLFTTDAAGRELDIPPSVDYIVQFEPPEDPREYILRIGRIAVDPDRYGRALLFLTPSEERGFLKYFRAARVPVIEYEFPPKVARIHGKLERSIGRSTTLTRYAREAYASYMIAYASHTFRDVYNVHDLDKDAVAAAFGFVEPPVVDEEMLYNDAESVNGGAHRSSAWMKREKSWRYANVKHKAKEPDHHHTSRLAEDGQALADEAKHVAGAAKHALVDPFTRRGSGR